MAHLNKDDETVQTNSNTQQRNNGDFGNDVNNCDLHYCPVKKQLGKLFVFYLFAYLGCLKRSTHLKANTNIKH